MDEKPPVTPPPIPPQPLPYASPGNAKSEQPYTDYDRVADTVGFVPNVRGKDNLYQLLAGAIGIGVGLVVALAMQLDPGLYIVLGIAGFIAGAVLYGIYLAIVGIKRGKRRNP